MDHIRNFSIIAHIDHGKSTLADRMLERTRTVEVRKMRDQVLDSMELERERGITIKMKPVRMHYTQGSISYIFNLIDTPGHIDFAYEVSRALKAVEGSILLVDATQGVQAQTLSTLAMAAEHGLAIIPVISKIDSPLARIEDVRAELVTLLHCKPESILTCSGKTGEGVDELLEAIIHRIPAPEQELAESSEFRGLIFDFEYSNHRGIIVYVRVFDGRVEKGSNLVFAGAEERFSVLETGVFVPHEEVQAGLSAGEIGYLVTGIKKPGIASVGDTLKFQRSEVPALQGYSKPSPVVWASIYPESQDAFPLLSQALERLRLSDSSFSFEEEASGILGRGYRSGFLGMLHLEIITERLRREFGLTLVVTTPSITYEVTERGGKVSTIYSPSRFPEHGLIESVREPWVLLKLILPGGYLSPVVQLLYDHEGTIMVSETIGSGRMALTISMPLRELMRNFFDKLKNVSSGFASFSYELTDMRKADVARIDVLVADEIVPAFSRIVARRRIQEDAEAMVERLYTVLPRQMFVTKVQAQALGRIISSRTLSALKKDVTGHLYGGDITRKMKLREKQKKGKKKMLARGKVTIPHEVFLKMMRGE